MTDSIPLSELSSAVAAKFERIGDKYIGRIVGFSERQQTDLKGKPLTFDDGSPRMQWVISIEDEATGDTKAFYAKGGKFQPAEGTGESMLAAISTAVRAANANSLDVGGRLGIAFTGRAEARPGYDQAKLYTAQYEPPPPASIPASDLFSA